MSFTITMTMTMTAMILCEYRLEEEAKNIEEENKTEIDWGKKKVVPQPFHLLSSLFLIPLAITSKPPDANFSVMMAA
jgi:hypothetical protein